MNGHLLRFWLSRFWPEKRLSNLFIILSLILAGWDRLQASRLSFNEEFGQTSLGARLAEEEDDARFAFWRSSLGFKQGDKIADFHLKLEHQEKNFKNRITDYTARRVGAGARRLSVLGSETVDWGLQGLWRDRSFKLLPGQNYQESKLRLFALRFHGFSSDLAFSRYHLDQGSNDSRLALIVAKIFPLKNTWELNLREKLTRHWAENRLRYKQEGKATLKAKLGWAHWDNMTAGIEGGLGDTKTLEEREDNLDFSFWKLSLKSRHPVKSNHSLWWAGSWRAKDDKGGIYNHAGNEAEIGWRWQTRWRHNQRLSIKPKTGYKRMQFNELPSLNYTKKRIGAAVATLAWSQWEAGAELNMDFYDFPQTQRRVAKAQSELSFRRHVASNADVLMGLHTRGSLVAFQAQIELML